MPETTCPNVLYLHSHDTGRYVQPYGYAVPMPNYQRLAEQGVLFRRAFSAAPTCSPSRAALLTGQSPHSAGMLGLAHRGFRLHDPSQHLAAVLRNTGYRTALAGMQHVHHGDANAIGYDRTLAERGADAATITSAAIDALRDYAGNPDQPFFLDAGFSETHRPFGEVDTTAARYVRPPVPLPDTPETRRDMAAFQVEAARLDASVGAILDALDETGLAASTLVILTTDHGLAFPGMKCNLTDHGTGVLLIVRGPGGFTGGRVIDSLVSQVDLFPTVCELLGIEAPAWLQGTSLLPVVRGEADEVNDAIFSEVTYHAAYEPQRTVRTRRWRYIQRYGDRETLVLPNCDESPSRELWLEAGWRDRPIAFEQLYDTVFDPIEVNNVASDPALATVLDDLRSRLDAWMAATNDPLLNGPVPLPPGASANDPAGVSPLLDDLYVAQDDGSLVAVSRAGSTNEDEWSGQARRSVGVDGPTVPPVVSRGRSGGVSSSASEVGGLSTRITACEHTGRQSSFLGPIGPYGVCGAVVIGPNAPS